MLPYWRITNEEEYIICARLFRWALPRGGMERTYQLAVLSGGVHGTRTGKSAVDSKVVTP